MARHLLMTLVIVEAIPFASEVVAAQTAQTEQTEQQRFGIIDNSFLVEEAFNQERGVFQNIFSFTRAPGGDWDFAFTQEWPMWGALHQFPYTVPISHVGPRTGVGDMSFNYRLQLMSEGPARPALAPRLSLLVPAGDPSAGLGDGALGCQVNVPFSKRQGNFYFHWNAGFTYLPAAEAPDTSAQLSLFSPAFAGSVIWQASSTLNVIVEALAEFDEGIAETDTTRTRQLTLSPGFRHAWNLAEKQIVVGAALPINLTANRASRIAILTYFSYEARFRR